MTSWDYNLYENKVTAAAKKKAGDKVIADLRGEKKKDDKKKKSDYTEYLKQQLAFKKEKYEDQKKRQIEKLKGQGKKDVEASKEKAKQSLRNVKIQRISSKEGGATATQKAGENLAALAGGVAGAAYHGARALMKKKKLDKKKKEAESKQADKKDPGTPGRPRKKMVAEPSTTARTPQPYRTKKKEEGQKRLMPSSGTENKSEPTPKKSVSAVVPKKPKQDNPDNQRVKKANVSVIEKPQAKLSGTPETKKLSPSIPKLPPAGPKKLPAAGETSASSSESIGQKARKDKKMKEKLIKDRRTPMESYSSWRDEILFEEFLSEIEEKKQEKKVIDIMKGKNKVIINPPMGEEYSLGQLLEKKLALYEVTPAPKTNKETDAGYRGGRALTNMGRDLGQGVTTSLGNLFRGRRETPKNNPAAFRNRERINKVATFLNPTSKDFGKLPTNNGSKTRASTPAAQTQIDKNSKERRTNTDFFGTGAGTNKSKPPVNPPASNNPPALSKPAPTARQQADAKTRATYDKLRKSDPKLAAKYGMAASRSRFGNQLKPKTPNPLMKGLNRPAPGSVPKPPAPQVKRPAPGSVSTQSGSTRGTTIKNSVEYPEISNILSEIQGGLWEGKKSEMSCNKPKAQAHGSGETGKSHVVKACSGGKEKLIRFGQLGVKGSPKKEGESNEYASRRNRFKTRHAKNIAKGKMSAAYWSNRVKW